MAVATKRVSARHQAYERALRTRREELVARLQDHRDEMVAERVPDDSYGLASRTLLEDLTVDSMLREQQLLGEIESALDRLEAGEYGVCQGCGADIPKRRLEALPWARFCVKCAEKRQVHWKN
jgi:DnaK suppressor protein